MKTPKQIKADVAQVKPVTKNPNPSISRSFHRSGGVTHSECMRVSPSISYGHYSAAAAKRNANYLEVAERDRGIGIEGTTVTGVTRTRGAPISEGAGSIRYVA